MSFGLFNYFFPLLHLLRPLFPIGHPHLPQIIPHIVFPSYSWPSLRSCCIRFPFVHGLGHSFIGHSFYMPQPAQSFVFYVSYYIFVINCFFQFFICFESPLSIFAFCVGPNILLNNIRYYNYLLSQCARTEERTAVVIQALPWLSDTVLCDHKSNSFSVSCVLHSSAIGYLVLNMFLRCC